MRNLIVCGTHLGFRTSLGRAEPCTAVRRRENLRSASFRDYTMAEPARDNGARPEHWVQGSPLPRPPTAGGLNTECRAQPCGAGVSPCRPPRRRLGCGGLVRCGS